MPATAKSNNISALSARRQAPGAKLLPTKFEGLAALQVGEKCYLVDMRLAFVDVEEVNTFLAMRQRNNVLGG